MKRIGRLFSRDYEFTGCTDMVLNPLSKILDRLREKGFDIRPNEWLPNRAITFPKGVAPESVDYSESKQIQIVEVDLTDEQKKQVKQVFGEDCTTLRVSVVPYASSRDIELTDDQQKKINKAVGVEMTSVFISREPIEATMK